MITRRLARPLSAFSPQSWTCPACARTSLPNAFAPQSRTQRRSAHSVPEIEYHDKFAVDGVKGLFTKFGYQLGWTTYQTMIIQKLNELLSGEPIANADTKSLTIQFARDPMNASLFNHASMAHNNHFFYEAFSTDPISIYNNSTKDPKYRILRESLEKTFGSIDTLRTTMLDTASAMFGPGFVWLVWMHNAGTGNLTGGDWRILTTYLAGTPYPEAGFRQQGIDMNTNNYASFGSYQDGLAVSNNVGKMGRHSAQGQRDAKIPPGGTSLQPVLCVNTWEHVYLYDYGLQGKRAYLSSWWDVVDWNKVWYRAPPAVQNPLTFGG